MKLAGKYPAKPLSAIPALLLEAFLAEQVLGQDEDYAAKLDDVATQRIHATYEGARYRASVCGQLRGHDCQAAALLMAIDQIDGFLTGCITVGGRQAVHDKLDADELQALQTVQKIMTRLLQWHFENGAGALLPIAQDIGVATDSAQAVSA